MVGFGSCFFFFSLLIPWWGKFSVVQISAAQSEDELIVTAYTLKKEKKELAVKVNPIVHGLFYVR